MRSKLILLASFVGLLGLMPLQAKKVSPEKAQIVAKNLVSIREPSTRSSNKLVLVHTEFQTSTSTRSSNITEPTYYIFSKGDNNGFVFISADDVATPVLGYVNNGNYQVDKLPINFESWMQSISDEIGYAIDNKLEQDDETKRQWDSYLNGNIKSIQNRATATPLVTTTWNQDAPYNNLCPGGSYTGCVATAMAQIMKYHNYPTSRNVTIPAYTTTKDRYNIPALEGFTYAWSDMLQSYGSTYASKGTVQQKEAVAKLMYDVGASVEMNYTTSGSGAPSRNMGKSLITYFNYDKGLQIKDRGQYSSPDWDNILRSEINAGRPIYYAGANPTSAHAFVCDGYDDLGKFHFNWGWGGYLDGYFVTNSLNPGTGGAGSGAGTYNEQQQIIVGIQPEAGGVEKAELSLDTHVTVDKTTLARGENFVIPDNIIWNRSLFDFSGTLVSALVDVNDNIVAIVGNYNGSDKFKISNWSGFYTKYIINTIPLDTKPGSYYVKIMYKTDEESDWTTLRPDVQYSDRALITVTDKAITHGIKIRSGSNLTSTKTSVKPLEEFNVTVGVTNRGTTTFNGNLSIALVDDNDELLEIIGELINNISLPTNYGYTSLTRTCKVSATNIAGNYHLRVMAKPNGIDDWSIVYADNNTDVDILPLTLVIDVPSETTWKPVSGSTDWNDARNWSYGKPGKTTKVTIAKGSSYPTLTEATVVDIIYIEAGAELKGQDLLTYNKAFVDYDFGTSDRSTHFRMLSLPLMEAYHGDFTFGNEPVVYFQTLQVNAKGLGRWVTAKGGTTKPLSAGTGFVLAIDPDTDTAKGLGLANGVLRLPYFDEDSKVDEAVHPTHQYIDWKSTFFNPYDLTQSYKVARSQNGYKLAGANVNVTPNFGQNNNGHNLALIGNPFVTTIDFDKLYQANNTLIKNNYYIWTKVGTQEGYIGYGPDGLFGLKQETPLTKDIAPLQGFVVEQLNDVVGDLNFNLNTVTSTSNGTLRSMREIGNKINIIAKNQDAEVNTYIAKRSYGSTKFGESDALKLMNELTNTPEVYTIKPSDQEMVSVGANITSGEDVEYPIGIATSYNGVITLTFSGMDNYGGDRVFFTDKLLNKTIELTGLSNYDYIFNYTAPVEGNEVVATNDRFSMKITSRTSPIENDLDKDEIFTVYSQNGFIHLATTNGSIMNKVLVYNMNGMLMYQSDVKASTHVSSQSFTHGIYIVKVKTETGIKNLKVIVK